MTKDQQPHHWPWLPRQSNTLLLHLGVWCFFFVLHAMAFAEMMTPWYGFLRATGNIGLSMGLFYGCAWAYHRYYESGSYVRYALLVLGLFVGIALLRLTLNLQLPMLDVERPYYKPGIVSFVFSIILTNLFTVLASLMYESLRARHRLAERQLQLENAQKEARLQFLRAQMNPHFLFNTLNNIYTLALLGSDKTAPLVLRLSQLLQYVIYEGQQDKVPLTKELSQLEEYIELFQLQHETPQHITLKVEQDRTDYQVAPLLLIPILENCFKHCDFAENPAAFTELTLSAQHETLSLEARNSFNPAQKQKDRVGGVGLENMRSRLALRYGANHQLLTEAKEAVFTLRLELPLS